MSILILLGPIAAFGQSNVMNVTVDGQTDTSHTPYALSVTDCAHTARVTWSIPSGACPTGSGVYVTTSSSCSTAPASTDYQPPVRSDGLSADVLISNLPTFITPDAGTAQCPGTGNNQLNKVCGTYQTSSLGGCSGTAVSGGFSTIYFKRNRPAAPSIDPLTILDGELGVSVSTTEGDIIAFHVQYAVADGGGIQEVPPFAPSVGGTRISNLTNGVTYSVWALAEDQVSPTSQLSDPSNTVQGTPIFTNGFFDRYLGAGGQERGGCGGIGAIILVWFLPGVVLVSLIRTKRSWRRPDKS